VLTAATATHSVDIVFWKATAFPCWRAMDRRCNRNIVSLASSVMAVMRRPISWTSSMAKPFHVPAVPRQLDRRYVCYYYYYNNNNYYYYSDAVTTHLSVETGHSIPGDKHDHTAHIPTCHPAVNITINTIITVVISLLVLCAVTPAWLLVTQAQFPFKHMHRTQCKHLHCVKNRIDSIVTFSCARTACVSYVTCACVLLFFACVVFLRFLRTFYFACVFFLTQGLACVWMETGL